MDAPEDSLLARNRVPIIDLSHIVLSRGGCSLTMKKIGRQLERCLMQNGVALLVNHGIPQYKLNMLYRDMDNFRRSNSVDEDTLKYCSDEITPQPRALDAQCSPYTYYNCCYKEEYHSLNMRWLIEKLAEEERQPLCNTLGSLSDEFQKVSTILLHALAMALGDIDYKYLVNAHNEVIKEKNDSSLQVLYSLRQGNENYGGRRINSNAQCEKHDDDLNTFTLLAQDPDSNFEVLTGDNKWTKVGHLPGAILFHAGKLLQNWTSGKYQYLEYRIMTPEENLLQKRSGYVSLFTVTPDRNAVIDPVLIKLCQMMPESVDQTKKSQKRYVLLSTLNNIQRRLKFTKITDVFHVLSTSRY